MARILYGEDDPDVRELVRFKLQAAGHVIDVVADGAAALERYASHPADLVILDIRMPEVDGLEVCRRLAAATPRPRILLVTAWGREDDIDAGYDAGADDYVVKPFSPRELAGRVDALLGRGDTTDDADA